jgi:hypothetical protein
VVECPEPPDMSVLDHIQHCEFGLSAELAGAEARP